MSSTKKTVISSVFCALGVVIMYIGSLIDTLDITMACFASFIVVVSVLELKGFYPYLVYGATSVLSFILLPNKSVCLIYVLFFGYYPMLKKMLEKMRFILSWIVKLGIFNLMLAAFLIIAEKVLYLPLETTKTALILLLNVIFVAFDITLTMFITAYVVKFRKKLSLDRFFK